MWCVLRNVTVLASSVLGWDFHALDDIKSEMGSFIAGALLYEYIGVGNEPGIDFAIQQSAVDVIPVPAASSQLPYYFIIFGLTDQGSPGALSSGNFYAFGSYDQGNTPLQWKQADIDVLKGRGTNVQVGFTLGLGQVHMCYSGCYTKPHSRQPCHACRSWPAWVETVLGQSGSRYSRQAPPIQTP